MLTPLQQFIQDRILLSIYPGCSIEEAREKELEKFGCCLTFGTIVIPRFVIANDGTIFDDGVEIEDGEIIGLLPSLPRVMRRLGENYGYEEGYILYVLGDCGERFDKRICKRKLLNEDGTDATLRDQSEETQKAIALLLGYDENI